MPARFYFGQVGAAGGTTTADLASAGASTVAWVGAAVVAASLAVAPTSAANWVGSSSAPTSGDLSATGASTVSWVGQRQRIDLFDNGSGGAPDGWTMQWHTGDVSFTEQAAAPGFLRSVKTVADGRRALSINSPNPVTDIEVMVRARTLGTLGANELGPAVFLRGGGATTTETGYAFRLQTDGSSVLNTYAVSKYVSGTQTVFSSGGGAFPWLINTWYRLRCRVITNTGTSTNDISFKVWLDGSAEPGGWTYTTTDNAIASGWVGVFHFDTSSTIEYDWFSLGTNGLPALDPSAGATLSGDLTASGAAQASWDSTVSVTSPLLAQAGAVANWVSIIGTPWSAFAQGQAAWTSTATAIVSLTSQGGSAANWAAISSTAWSSVGASQAAWTGAAINSATLSAQASAVANWVAVLGSQWSALGVGQVTWSGLALKSATLSAQATAAANWVAITSTAWSALGAAQAPWRSTVAATATLTAQGAATAAWSSVLGSTLTTSSTGLAQWNSTVVKTSTWATQAASVANWVGIFGRPWTSVGASQTVWASAAAASSALLAQASAVANWVSILNNQWSAIGAGQATWDATAAAVTSLTAQGASQTNWAGSATTSGNAVTMAGSSSVLWRSVTRPLIGTYYSQMNTANLSVLSNSLGWQIPIIFEFCSYDNKTVLKQSVANIAAFWDGSAGKAGRLYLSLAPQTKDNSTWTEAQIFAGTHDADLDLMAQQLIAGGHANAMIRIGWEMNGGWQPWGATTANYIGAFQRIVTRFRAQSGQAFEFVWAPNIKHLNNAPTSNYYPGDSFVDWIAPDGYGDQYDHDNMTPDEIWEKQALGYDVTHSGPYPGSGVTIPNAINYGFRWFINYAAARGKKFGIAETGCGFRPDKHGFGDQDIWWRKISQLLTTYGPPTGALLGVFDQDPPSPDYWSSFSRAGNSPYGPPAQWYQQKDRTAWSFRKYFGEGILPDLSTAAFETVAPTGMTITIQPGFGTFPNLTVPQNTPDNALLAIVTCDNGYKVWMFDAGETDGGSTAGTGGTPPANAIETQVGSTSFGYISGGISGAPQGGLLNVRPGRTASLISGKQQILGIRNGLGGQNLVLNVSVVTPFAGTPKGWDYFDGTGGVAPYSFITGWSARWERFGVVWGEVVTGSGVARAATTANARYGLQANEVGVYADIDVATSVRVTTTNAFNHGGQAWVIGGVFARVSGFTGSETGYFAGLRIEADGTKQFVLRKYVNSVQTNIGGTPVTYAWNDNEFHEVRLQVSGTAPVTLRAKVWLASDPEPGAWTVTTTDTSITVAGRTGVMAGYAQSGGSNVEFDYFGWDTIGVGTTSNPVPAASNTGSLTASAGSAINWVSTGPMTVGGVPIGAAGTGFYSGYVLAWGDEFTTASIIGPTTPNNLYPSTRGSWAHNGARGGGTIYHYFLDPHHTGYFDANRGSPVSFDTHTIQGGTRLKLPTRLSTPTERNYLNATPQAGNVREIIASAISTVLEATAYPGTDDIIIEARLRLTTRGTSPLGNPVGWHPALWTLCYNPVHMVDGLEQDVMEANSQNAYGNSVLWAPGQNPVGIARWGPVNAHDDTDRTFTVKVSKTAYSYYINEVQQGATIAQDGNPTNQPSFAILTSLTMGVFETWNGETFSITAWRNDPDGAVMEVDWIRFWRKSTGFYLEPLTTASPSNTIDVDYAGSASITLPSKTALWGNAGVSEYVQAIGFEANDPSDLDQVWFEQFPKGVSYNSGTRVISVDFAVAGVGRWPGRLYVTVVAWTTQGGVSKPLRLAINRGPRIRMHKQMLPIGVPYTRDIYQECDVGNLTPKVITVEDLPPGLAHNGTGLLNGTPTTIGTYPVTITVENNRGQTATSVVDFVVSAGAGMLDFINDTYVLNDTTDTSFANAVTAGKLTFARAREAYYWGETNTFGLFASGQLRRGRRGALLEPARSGSLRGSRSTNTAVPADTFQTGMAATTGGTTIDDPALGTTAERQTVNTANSTHQIGQNFYTGFLPGAIGTVFEMGWVARGGTCRYLQFSPSSTVNSGLGYFNVDMHTGDVTASGGTGIISRQITPLSNGWWWIGLTWAVTANSAFGITINPLVTGLEGRVPTYTNTAGLTFETFECMLAPAPDGRITTPVYNTPTGATSATLRPADDLKIVCGTKIYNATLVFDDRSTQALGAITGTYSVNPATITKPNVIAVLLEPYNWTPQGGSVVNWVGGTVVAPSTWTAQGASQAAWNSTLAIAGRLISQGTGQVAWTATYLASSRLLAQAGAVASWVGFVNNQWSCFGTAQVTWTGVGSQAWASQGGTVVNWVGIGTTVSNEWSCFATSQVAWNAIARYPWTSAGASTVNWVGAVFSPAKWTASASSSAAWIVDISTKPNIKNNKGFVDANSNLRRRIPIPDPTEEGGSLQKTSKALKEAVETLQGQIPDRVRQAAVTWQDLLNVGVVKPTDEDKAK